MHQCSFLEHNVPSWGTLLLLACSRLSASRIRSGFSLELGTHSVTNSLLCMIDDIFYFYTVEVSGLYIGKGLNSRASLTGNAA